MMQTEKRDFLVLALLVLTACDSAISDSVETQEDPVPIATTCPSPGLGITWGGDGFSELDTQTDPHRLIVLMGGGREVDAATREFLKATAGGDVRVLRTTGSVISYPTYFKSSFDIDPLPRTVATMRTDDPAASADPAVSCHLERAEGVWMAGGNQADYVFGWTSHVHDRLADPTQIPVVGGTSAGAMVLGELVFDAGQGGVSSEWVLQNPTSDLVSISRSPMAQPELSGWIVDTHFSERDREGRLLGFLARARALTDKTHIMGVGLDESAAVVISVDSVFVKSGNDRSVYVYRIEDGPPPGPGALDLGPVLRATLTDGYRGAWPLDLDATSHDTLFVSQGILHIR